MCEGDPVPLAAEGDDDDDQHRDRDRGERHREGIVVAVRATGLLTGTAPVAANSVG